MNRPKARHTGMAKRITRDELGASVARLQDEVTAQNLFIRHLTPREGFYFVESRRSFSAYIVQVDAEGCMVARYPSTIGSEERRQRDANLYRSVSENERPWLLKSLFEAQDAERDYLRRISAPTAVPAADASGR